MRTLSLTIISALAVTFSLSTAQVASSKTGVPVASQARETLKEIDADAAHVADEAFQLRQFIDNPEYSPESHLDKLLSLKDDVNRMGREIGSLEAERESLAPWERRAIDNTLPLLKETAANTRNAIRYFNENRSHLWAETYRGYADNIWRDSEQVARTLKDYLNYANAHDQEQQLEQRLGVTGD